MNPVAQGANAPQPQNVFRNGVPCRLIEREEVIQGLPGVARWKQAGVAEKVGAVVLAPLTLAEGVVAGVCYAAAYPFLSEDQREGFKDAAIARVLKGKKTVKTHERDETAARYQAAFGFDPRDKDAVQNEVQNALDAGNRVKSMDGSPHEYIILNNSAIIMIPNGNIEEAYVRTLYNASTGKPFVGNEFKKALKVVMELHDSIIEQGGETYGVWIIDLPTKQVRVLDSLPDDINQSLDGKADKVLTNIDAKRFETCLSFYDDEKTEGKNKLDGETTRRRDRDHDRGGPPAPRPAPRNGGVQPPLVLPGRGEVRREQPQPGPGRPDARRPAPQPRSDRDPSAAIPAGPTIALGPNGERLVLEPWNEAVPPARSRSGITIEEVESPRAAASASARPAPPPLGALDSSASRMRPGDPLSAVPAGRPAQPLVGHVASTSASASAAPPSNSDAVVNNGDPDIL